MSRVLCIGHAVQDFVFSVDEMPARPDKYRASGLETVGGGPAATAAVAVAKLGGDALLASRVGDDQVGESIIAELEGHGVDCAMVRRLPERTSSLSAVIVDKSGERLIVNYLDAAMDSDPTWLPERLDDDVGAVLADTRWPEGALYGLKLAKDKRLPAILDADLPVPADSQLVTMATHVAFSENGLAEYSGSDDAGTGLNVVADRLDAWCCVTLGERGTLYMENGELHRVPAFDVDVRDTLGAGDVWHGAFALALTEESVIDDAFRFASAAAALKVKNGCGRAGCPSRSDVDHLLQQHSSENGE